jgi:SPP1 gp7 family putative phage head morphogenesis protein
MATKPPKISVNEEIQDRTIRHLVFLERYKTSEVRRIRKILDEEIIPGINEKIERRLLKILERGSDLGPDTTTRLKELEKELTKLSRELAEKTQVTMIEDLTDLTRDEIQWQANVVRESLGFDLDTVVPSPRSVAKIIKNTSFAGLKLDQWFDTVARSTQRNIMTAVNRGIVEGETTDQIIRRIRGTKKLNFTDGVWNTTRNQVSTVTRSAINHASNQARIEFFKENEDILQGMKWISTLDSRTSETCAALDGQVFPLDKGPRPPAHPNCRSTMTAVLKDADELGLKKIPAGKRAAIDGQVPGSVTYGQWLKNQPVYVQESVLGVTKAKLFRDGKLPIERFVGADLKPLTLDQLRELEKSAFERAGL